MPSEPAVAVGGISVATVSRGFDRDGQLGPRGGLPSRLPPGDGHQGYRGLEPGLGDSGRNRVLARATTTREEIRCPTPAIDRDPAPPKPGPSAMKRPNCATRPRICVTRSLNCVTRWRGCTTRQRPCTPEMGPHRTRLATRLTRPPNSAIAPPTLGTAPPSSATALPIPAIWLRRHPRSRRSPLRTPVSVGPAAPVVRLWPTAGRQEGPSGVRARADPGRRTPGSGVHRPEPGVHRPGPGVDRSGAVGAGSRPGLVGA